jgi:hypothetical protein
MQVEAFRGGCPSALFIGAANDYNSVISNSMPCPFLGEVSGSYATLQSSIGCFMYSIVLCYYTPSSLRYTSLLLYTYQMWPTRLMNKDLLLKKNVSSCCCGTHIPILFYFGGGRPGGWDPSDESRGVVNFLRPTSNIISRSSVLH